MKKIQKTFTYQGREHSVVFTKKFFKKPSLKLNGTDCEIVKDSYSYLDWYLRGKATLNDEEFVICIYGKQVYILKDGVDIETEQQFVDPYAMVKLRYFLLNIFIYSVPLLFLEYYTKKIDWDKFAIYPTAYLYILGAASFIILAHCMMGSTYITRKPYMKKRVKMLLVNLLFAGMCLWVLFLCFLIGFVT